jgi:cell division septal protein FtsQ
MELSLPFPLRVPRGRAGRPSSGHARRPGERRAYRAGAVAAIGEALWRIAGDRLALRVSLGLLVALPLLGGGWFWLRDSSLVAVEHVHISGVHGPEAAQIRTALDGAAARMTTLDFQTGALRSAVASYALVGALQVKTGFPHSVSISVKERPPVAALLTAGGRTAVAADGTVLGPSLLSASLPSVSGSIEPVTGARVGEAATLGALAVLGAVPPALGRFVVRAYNGLEGLTVAMRGGLLVYFGDGTRPHAKWLSLARVLTSPSSAGATYIDVRLAERPAAGFSSTSNTSSSSASTSPGASSSAPAAIQIAGSNPTAAALAASLERAVGGGSSSSSTSPTTGQNESAAKENESVSAAATSTGSTENSSATSTGSTENSTAGATGSPENSSASSTGSTETKAPEEGSTSTGG